MAETRDAETGSKAAGAPPARVFGNRVLVTSGNIAEARVDDAGDAPKLAKGEALFAVSRAALTANNVTYAAMGETMGYWRFFPAPAGTGTPGVWGFADCIGSEAKGIRKGDRFYGYWPLAERLLVETDGIGASGFYDPSEHRQGLADIYNRYDRRDDDGKTDAERVEALYRPLFLTGWLISLTLEGASDFGAKQVVLSSASSKTAIACAWALSQREGQPGDGRPKIIGLTSPGNIDYCEQLGIYDVVHTYGDVGRVAEDQPTVFVDFAGSADIRRRVHEHFATRLGRSIAVGLTHWKESGEGSGDLPGPEPKMFFAPDAVGDQMQRSGAADFNRRSQETWEEFAEWVAPRTKVEAIASMADAVAAWHRLAGGDMHGGGGLVVELPD